MKSQMGLLMNIVLGIVGAAVASWLLGFFGIAFGGWIGYLIAGFIGACILIAIARVQRRFGKHEGRRARGLPQAPPGSASWRSTLDNIAAPHFARAATLLSGTGRRCEEDGEGRVKGNSY